jgi:hypothetical protein
MIEERSGYSAIGKQLIAEKEFPKAEIPEIVISHVAHVLM